MSKRSGSMAVTTFRATTPTTSRTMPVEEISSRFFQALRVMPASQSSRLAVFENDHGREEHEPDDGEEVDPGPGTDQAAVKALEVRAEAEEGDRIGQPYREHAHQQRLQEAPAQEHLDQADEEAHDEGDHLVLRHGRGPAGDREIRARHEQAAQVARDDQPRI